MTEGRRTCFHCTHYVLSGRCCTRLGIRRKMAETACVEFEAYTGRRGDCDECPDRVLCERWGGDKDTNCLILKNATKK